MSSVKKKIPYDPRITGIDNLNRILQDAGIPEELLDDVEIVSVKDASLPEFSLYRDGSSNKMPGNTALKVNYSGELAKLSGKVSDTIFYDRTPPIPDIWEDKVMFARDSEMKNIGIDQYVKNRWLQDGFPFVGEVLSFEIAGRSGNLEYGRNIINVKAPTRSYGLCGTAVQKVQYFVDLNDKVAKIVTVVNPFLSNTTLTNKREDCYVEMGILPDTNVDKTERKILERFLSEAYGLIRGKAILKEIDAENIKLYRSPNFRDELRNPQTPEQEIEKKASKNYVSSMLYTLSETQDEDETSHVYGNFRLMIGRGHLAKLMLDSNKFEVEKEQAFRFKADKVKSFIFSEAEDNHAQFEIELSAKYPNEQKAFEVAKKVLYAYFGEYATFVDITKEHTENNRMTVLIQPSDKISDYVGGDIKAFVTFIIDDNAVTDNCGCGTTNTNTDPDKVVVKRVLNGFSGVSIAP